MDEPDHEPNDDQVKAALRQIAADFPSADLPNLVAGRLAGPASPNRPNVPVWDYLTLAEDSNGPDLEVLTAMRFPVRFIEGVVSVTSIDEELRPFPTSFRGAIPKPRIDMDARKVIDRYRFLHGSGVVEWDPDERGIVYTQPISAFRATLEEWYGMQSRTE